MDSGLRVYVLDGQQYLINMTEEGRDYFLQFINSSSQANHKLERKADLSLLMQLRLPEVAKKEEVCEKMHPLLQIAYEKKTKASTAVDEIIGQRIRCSTYVEIAKEEEENMERRKKRGPRYALGQKRLASKESNQERSQAKTKRVNDNDSDRMHGPPYRPNVLKMEELFATPETQADEIKPYRYHAGSRSRSKHAKKVLKQIRNEKLKRERELRKAEEEKRKMDEEIPSQKEDAFEKEASRPIDEPVNKQIAKIESNMHQGELKQEDKPIKASIHQQEPHLSKQKAPIASPNTSSIQNDLAERQRRIQEREAALQREKEKLQKEKEQRRIEKEKRQIERRAVQIAQRQQKLIRKEAALQKKLHYQDKPKSRKEERSSKRSKGNYESSSHKSTNSSMQDQPWRHYLRQITHYNPHDPKYRHRDRQQIKESSFSRLNKEEARSRKLGVLEEQRELQRERRRKQY